MKNLMLIALFVFISYAPSFSQIEELKGIGVFKIGETKVDDVSGLCNSLKIKQDDEISTMKQQRSFTNSTGRPKYAQIVFEPATEEPSNDAPMHSDIKRFLISLYKINDVKLTNFLLTFYKEWLVEIEFEGDLKTVEEIFIAKYGEPTKELDEKDVPFVYKYTGNKIEKKELTIDSRWKQGKIEAQFYTHLAYMPDGSPLIVEYFKISNIEVSEEVSKKESQGYKEWYENKKLNESTTKKSKYSDF